MSKIKIRLEVLSDHQLIYQVLEQSEELRGTEADREFLCTNNKYAIRSMRVPDISTSRVWIRGAERSRDNWAVILSCENVYTVKQQILQAFQEWADNGYFEGENKEEPNKEEPNVYSINGYKIKVERWESDVLVQVLETPPRFDDRPLVVSLGGNFETNRIVFPRESKKRVRVFWGATEERAELLYQKIIKRLEQPIVPSRELDLDAIIYEF